VEIVTGKLIAIAHVIINLIHIGAGQNRTGAPQQPLLGRQFLFGLQTFPRPAAGTGPQQIQFTDITIYAAGSGWHSNTK